MEPRLLSIQEEDLKKIGNTKYPALPQRGPSETQGGRKTSPSGSQPRLEDAHGTGRGGHQSREENCMNRDPQHAKEDFRSPRRTNDPLMGLTAG